MNLGRERHRAVRVDRQPVRGTPERSAARRGVDLDEPERLEFGGHCARGGARDAQPRTQRRAGRGAALVDQRQRRTELRAAP